MKVGLFLSNFGISGVTRVAIELYLRLKKKVDITFICYRVLREIEGDLDIIELKSTTYLELWKKLHKMTNQFDIIHTHSVGSLPGLTWKKKMSRSRIIYTHHGLLPFKYLRRRDFRKFVTSYLLGKCFISKADVSVGISDHCLQELKDRFKANNLLKISNGVDLKQFDQITTPEKYARYKSGDPMLLKVGSIEKINAIEYHIASMPSILKKYPAASLVFIGGGRDLNRYRQRVNEMGLESSITFLGHIPHKRLSYYYNAADVIVDAGYFHSFDLPLLEGMACGRPFIVRDAYAMREHASASHGGFAIKGKDYREIGNALDLVLDKYSFFASNSRQYAEHFDWDGIATQYKELYDRTMKQVC